MVLARSRIGRSRELPKGKSRPNVGTLSPDRRVTVGRVPLGPRGKAISFTTQNRPTQPDQQHPDPDGVREGTEREALHEFERIS